MNEIINRDVQLIDLGLIDYKQAWDYQTELFEQILHIKQENRKNPEQQKATPNYLIFCEHPHVFTLGKSGKAENLLVKPEELESIQATYYHINRGGDITYHGPGQIVVYPIFDLENFFTDIHKYMRVLEETVIQTLAEYKIVAGRIEGLTGVWIDWEDEKKARKICALGVKTSRWVSMHGLAFNVNTDLKYFDYIIPCGIDDKAVTSMQQELQREISFIEVKTKLKQKLEEQFDFNFLIEDDKRH
ncbi:MAG TPA: lipoyl(octanoyl) transferase LipB [Cyclobacteriaceae bacterium]|nr:lipoyl(octanoyl) transferase LipB [Cyclobacteriaceae bacterium]